VPLAADAQDYALNTLIGEVTANGPAVECIGERVGLGSGQILHRRRIDEHRGSALSVIERLVTSPTSRRPGQYAICNGQASPQGQNL
jgi:hypothetical protein